jgi:hypothetical protein
VPGGVCQIGSAVTVVQTVAVGDALWIEIDCAGSVGWVETESLTAD